MGRSRFRAAPEKVKEGLSIHNVCLESSGVQCEAFWSVDRLELKLALAVPVALTADSDSHEFP